MNLIAREIMTTVQVIFKATLLSGRVRELKSSGPRF